MADFHPIRVGFAAVMLMEGRKPGDISRAVAEEYGISDRQADRYLAAARQVVAGKVELDRAAHRKWIRAQTIGLFAAAKSALTKATTIREMTWVIAECRGCLAQLVMLDKLAYDAGLDLDEHSMGDEDLLGHMLDIFCAVADRSPALLAVHAAELGRLARTAKKATEA